ncbi:DEAD/DEAH box helicase [Halomonas alkaliantarctica]|uniref:DEAD/DEAH box helicase n=1 Tax=Halomonas alkaliantarctica TaxID=232346 RepID=UPI00054FC598|nr:ATP-binding domain-containing protein [Halomonas alkaliantarctica]
MDNSWFFYDGKDEYKDLTIIKEAKEFSHVHELQLYVINRPLNDSKYYYDYDGGVVFLMPGYSIVFLDCAVNAEDFDYFYEDFIEDVGSLADKYRHRKAIGRPRDWKRTGLIKKTTLNEIDSFENLLGFSRIEDSGEARKCELLISLITGSVNDIDKVGVEQPQSTLEKVKRKILLFDGEQTRFVYQPPKSKVVRIQGMSGAGKTELLLHKLKEIYGSEDEPKVMFTCHNKILASSLRNRIPEFFDFMRVDQQIAWHERLWCVHAWGSRNDIHSGAYRYICAHYGVEFFPFSPRFSFEDACAHALEAIGDKPTDENKYAFDFMLIDESQDFPEVFFKLAEKVTKKRVYVAGDIFQSIFDNYLAGPVRPDFLLRKCYRTDPRTLMFSHGLGTGMFEVPKLTWLEKDEWEACGYQVQELEGKYLLKREPVRRFEDINDQSMPSVEIVECGSTSEFPDMALEIVKIIKGDHPTVEADDIGTMFYQPSQYGYSVADRLSMLLSREFEWKVNKAYETKSRGKGDFFISNQNNVKGLEFPFVICFLSNFSREARYRNALYMMLTRSFIKTYIVVKKPGNEDILKILKSTLLEINTQGHMTVSMPSDNDEMSYVNPIEYDADSSLSLQDMVEDVCNSQGITDRFTVMEINKVASVLLQDDYDRQAVEEVIESNIRFLRKQ